MCCRAVEDCPAKSRTAVLQRSLSALVLPHSFRLPLPALAPALPSALHIPGTETEVVEVIGQTLLASIGVLAMPTPSGVDGGMPAATELPTAGLVVTGAVVDKCRVVYCNLRRRCARSLVVLRVGREADALRVVVATASSTVSEDGARGLPTPAAGTSGAGGAGDASALAYSCTSGADDVDLHALTGAGDAHRGVQLPRDLTFLNSCVTVVAVTADDVTVACEQLHSSVLNVLARVWRESGLPVGDVVPPYVYGVHNCPVPDAPASADRNAGNCSAGSGCAVFAMGGVGNPLAAIGGGEAVSSRLFGMMMSHEQVT